MIVQKAEVYSMNQSGTMSKGFYDIYWLKVGDVHLIQVFNEKWELIEGFSTKKMAKAHLLFNHVQKQYKENPGRLGNWRVYHEFSFFNYVVGSINHFYEKMINNKVVETVVTSVVGFSFGILAIITAQIIMRVII